FKQRLINEWQQAISNLSSEQLNQISQLSREDIKNISEEEDVRITNEAYPDNTQHPYFLEGADLIISLSPNLSVDDIESFAPDIGITGIASLDPLLFFRPDLWTNLGIQTIVHDILSLYQIALEEKTGESPGILEAVYEIDSVVLSAIFVPLEAILDDFISLFDFSESQTPKITSPSIIGASLGGKIATYFVNDNFASQLLANSIGKTVGSWVGSAIENEFDFNNKSLESLALPDRFIGNLVSISVSLGSGELSENIIDALKIEDTLTQMGVDTLTEAVVDYAFTSIAREYFPNFAENYLQITSVKEITRLDLINSYKNALASYAGSEFYKTLVRWNIIGEGQLNQGSAIGGSLGAVAIPGLASWLGFTALTGPIGIFVGTVVGSLIGGVFGDEDFPRAAYAINIVNGEFVTQFSYELDDGNTEIARQMGEAAKEILNFLAETVGGQLMTVENVYYGHYKEQLVYQLQDNAPGSSSFRTRVGFSNAQAAIEAGVVYQLTKTQIEGGDRYIKRLFNNYTNSRSNLDDFNELLQIAKEYGTYLDNPTLYQEYINKLAANSIQDADKRITALQSHPWDSFVPAELNDDLIKKVATNLLPTTIIISIEGNDLIVNGERIYGWVKTQPENKIQFLQFTDGRLYTINVDKDNKVTLNLYTKDPTIRDFGLDILPSQVRLSLSGNNLNINGEIIANWLTNNNNRVEILRFADGSRFKIVVENGTVKLENELVANFKTVLAKAREFNLSTPQVSDNYKGNNVTRIISGNGGVVQGNDNSDDVLISSSAAETLRGGKGDDVYRYSLGNGKDTIDDIGGVDVIEFDSNIQLSNLRLQQSSNNLIISIINPSNPSAPITNQLTITNFLTNKIEFIRLGNNQEYFLDNSSGQWQLKATNNVQTATSSNTTIQGTIGADVLRGLGENDTLLGGAGNDTYLYSFGDGLNTTIYDTGDYEGKVRDGGIDTLVLGTNTIHSLKLQDKDLIITVSYILPGFNASGGNNEAQPIIITIKNWVDENSRIEFIRLANGKDFYPTLAADGSVSLQAVLTQGESTLDVQLDVPDNYVLSAYKLAVVDLFGNGLQLISAQDSFAMSDLDNDGYLEQTGWVSPSDGILVIDLNNDGRITELNEFISLTTQPNVTSIASLNSNGDRLLNSQDTNFERIRVWIDANGNRKVELGELAALHRYGIDDISLASQQKNFEVAGNLITASTYFTQLGYEFRKRSQIFDVAFAYNPNGVKLETLPGGINKFNFENKPDIIIADDTAGNLNLTIDPTITYAVTGGKGNDILTILASSTTGGILNGGAGDDTLTGAGGSDIINGGKGKDVIKAGAGDDTITVDADDIITSLDGGAGFDIVTIDLDSRLHLILKDSNNVEAIIGTKISNQITYIGVKPVLISGDLGNDILTGGEGDDQIEGGEGKDKLYGNKGKDLLLGGLDDDSLYGEQNDDQLYGQEGDDFLDGGDGNDILNGGIGNDSLKGGSGQNTYIFGRGYGIDTITQNNNADKDIISFKAGISPSDITFWRRSNNDSEKNNLYLAIKNTHDRLIITDQLVNNAYGIDQFTFADGTIWTRENIQAWLLQSTTGDDYLVGYQSNDTLDGGAGNDLLNGGAGNNTYVFGRGYGIDTIAENSNTGTDTLSFKAGINPSDITFWRKSSSYPESDNLYLAIKNTHDQIIIEDQFRSGPYGIDQFVFANGTIWTRENIQTWLLQSTTDDDYLLGYQSNDTLDGGAGNDLLNGGYGNNTYVFGRGYGIDTIVENYNTGTDTLSFKTGINPSDITFWRKSNSYPESDNLYLAIKNTHDQIIIEDQFRSGPYGIDQFVFANGTIWTRENIQTWLLQSTTGDDYLLGYQSNDTLDGGAGNDLLNGGYGNNTYIFGRGYAVDTIVENYNTGTDTVSFKAGISKSDVVFWRKSNSSTEQDNLYLAIKNTNDRLIIEDQFRSGPYGIDQFIFADGTTITRSEINSMSLPNNLPEDNLVTGDANANTLENATGNDTLAGGIGNDTYIFKQGYGQDIIQEGYSGLNSYYDTVKFGAGLTTNTMEIVRQGDDLIFKVKGSSDRLTIKDQFNVYEVYAIEEFQFDNGATVWTKENIKQHLLKSTNGNDYIVGYSEGINNETLDGGLGNDTLAGGSGNDTYIFKQGYGQDIIQEGYSGLNSYYDTVKFGAGLTTNTMEIIRQGDDLIFKVKGSSDRLTIKDQFNVYEVYAIEEFQFDNGATVWTKENIKQHLLKSTPGDDYLVGYSWGIRNDILDGGLGNDTLVGGTGDDTYIFKQGYGQDIIQEDYSGLNSYYDTVKFGAGLTIQTMEIVREGNDLVFKVKGSSDRLTIKNQFDYPFEAISIEEFQFDNGATIWTKENIKQYLLKSTSADDYIVGYSEGINNETLDGGLGNDTLVGGTGNDTYIFKQGYGQDIIQEGYSGFNSYYDTVKFGAGLTTNTMEIVRQGNDLIFKVKGSSDRLTIKNQFDYPFEAISIEEFQFDNGATIWTKEDIKQYLLQSTDGDDYIVGYSEGINNETLDGGLGDDTLVGGAGNDTYIFKHDYGQDIIQEGYYAFNSYYDTVKFGRGLTPQTMEIVRQGNDLIFKVKDNIDQLTIKNQFDYPYEVLSVEEFQFDNGATIWTKEDIKNYLATTINNAPIVQNAIIDQTIGSNSPFNFTIPINTFSDSNIGDSLSYTATKADGTSLPSWLKFNPITRTFTGIPTVGDVSTLNIKVVATDNKRANVSDTFAINIRNLTGTAGNDSITGTFNDDVIQGLGGNDILLGLAGNDTLDGGTGQDTMTGGLDNDTYIVDNSADKVVENANEGTDTVRSSISYTLGDNIENLVLTGTSSLSGTGNTLNNLITGNTGANTLNGKAGDDIINGEGGNDTLNGESGNDTLNGGTGNDSLDGGAGDDVMLGGAGDDTYYTDSSNDQIIEVFNEGTDTVRSAISWTLGYNLENLILTGSNAINGTGNALKNSITGNTANNTLSGGDNDDTLNGDAGNDILNGDAGNDSLDGGVGNDVMIGGAGNDTYYTDSINDQIIEATNAGTDTVRSAISWTLSNNLENLILTGSNAINGTGNALVNNMTGNSANNSLSGGDNNDTLNGGDGDDILNGGNGNDTLIGGNGNDTLVGGVGSDKLTGGAGNDKFVFNSLSEGIDTITDFSSTNDVLVVQSLLASFNYTGTNPIANGYMRGIQSGSNTLIQVDADGVGSSAIFSTLVTLNNFTASNFSQNNLIF
ncbi:putative Ig domain-containing protein, partial [Trichormus variabilis FSR]|nr:putative Ig domain-containing protein [Trichormus variabilis FSR]